MSARGPHHTGELKRRSDDALAPYEREILAMWDSGQSYADMMAATGRTLKAVRTVCENYDDRPDIGVLDKLKDANLQFVARIRLIHGAYIAARA